MKKILIIIALISSIIVSLSLTGCSLIVNGKEVTSVDFSNDDTTAYKTEVKEITISEQDRINVSNSVGKIKIKSWDGNTVKVTSVKKGSKSSDDMKVEISNDSSSINIKVHYKSFFGWFNNRSVELEILVPSGIKYIKADAASGKITLSDIKDAKEFDLSSVSGSVDVENSSAENYKLNTTSGKCSVDNLIGNGSVKSISGSIEVNNMKGDTKFNTTSGRISADTLEGNVDLETVSGSTNFMDSYIKGDSRFHSISGSVNIEASKVDLEGQYNISSISGSINLQLPAEIGFNLDAKSISGSISNTLDGSFTSGNHHVSGKVGNGGAGVNIDTVSGSINISQ